MRVRLIRQEDIEPMIDLARDMHKESPVYRDIPFSDAAMRGWFTASVEKSGEYFCAVIEDAGAIVGAMLALAAPVLFSEVKAAYEMGLYVYPKYRGTGAAWRLYAYFEKWAKTENCGFGLIGVSAGVNDDVGVRFYKRLGYDPAGVSMRKELK